VSLSERGHFLLEGLLALCGFIGCFLSFLPLLLDLNIHPRALGSIRLGLEKILGAAHAFLRHVNRRGKRDLFQPSDFQLSTSRLGDTCDDGRVG
jgi:hypothetical protein